LSTVQSVAMKWTLNVRMARSAALRRLQFGGTYWNEMFSCFMKSYKFFEVSLPRRSNLGAHQRALKMRDRA